MKYHAQHIELNISGETRTLQVANGLIGKNSTALIVRCFNNINR